MSAGPGLRVVHVVALIGAHGEFGGPSAVALSHVHELNRQGHRAVLVTLTTRGTSRPSGLDPALWVALRARRLIPGQGMLGRFNLRLIPALWRELGRADVLHVHTGRDLVSLCALLLARLRGVTVMAQTHGMVLPRSAPSTRLFDLVFLRLLREARSILYLTPAEEQDLIQLLGPGARLRHLPNGVEPVERRTSGPGLPRVLFLARLHPVKRVLAFAEMATICARAGVEADFVVHGPDQGDLQALLNVIEDDGGHALRYAGALSHEAALTAVQQARVVVLPSSADWMPMTLLQAMAAGVPTVCTESCGLAPLLRAEGAGLVVDGTPQQLADAVTDLLHNEALASRVANSAQRLVERRFAIVNVVELLAKVYAEALSPVATRLTTRSSPSSGDRWRAE